MTSDVLIGQYPKQQCVRDRNLSSLLRWAAYVSAEDIPTAKPAEDWVRARMVADRLPGQIDSYVQRTIPYFMQDPAVIEDLHDFLNPFNRDDLEDQLSNINSSVIGAFMPRFALTDVTDDQVEQWYADHGFA